MALTGKTIGQLTYLNFPNNDTLIPVELSGGTYHIAYSAVNYTELTYNDLITGVQSGELTPGHFYLINDFQTIYDQPNFDHNGNPITTGNNKTGTTEPLLVLAISTSQLSPTAYSTVYPTDKITYDVTWNETEVTLTPAKGRITERIDSRGNRTDYDFRSVQFIRYVGFFSEDYLPGKVSIDGSGNVTGVGTTFTNYSAGQIIGIYYGANNAPMSCFRYYEVTSVADNTNMVVSGLTIQTAINTYYSTGLSLPNYMSPFQNNVTGGTYSDSSEYYTFNSELNYNTYIGNNINYNTFLLSNNVFLSGNYYDNILGGNSVGNTFNDDMNSNTFGDNCSFNIITNDYDRNNVNSFFQFNIIDCDMADNVIGNYFQYNMLGDNDGFDFDFNVIADSFQGNFITFFNDDFSNNTIGRRFEDNIINGSVNENSIGPFFTNNLLVNNFDENTIGTSFSNNTINSTFEGNQIGRGFFSNILNSTFNNNVIRNFFSTNEVGNVGVGGSVFQFNDFGSNTQNNFFTGNTENNIVGNNFTNNNIDYNFSYNKIGDVFQYNTIGHDFGFGGSTYRGNIIGNGFTNNIVGEYCYDNTFGDNCTSNNLADYFTNNKISYGMNNVTVSNLDTPGTPFQNNNFTYGYFSANLTLTGATGGNPVFYSSIPTNVTLDYADASGYVTFLSGGSIVTQTITV
jgi:hypothetical protein